jgi:hypothetical protein
LIYLLLPNSAEVYANLTNAQWHLAFFAFLVLVSRPPAGWSGAGLDAVVLIPSGLSGPFCLFLAPVAILIVYRDRNRTTIRRAVAVLGCCLVQFGVLIASNRYPASVSMLGAGPRRLAEILALRVVLSTLIGRHSMPTLLDPSWEANLLEPSWQSNTLYALVAGGALGLTVLACVRGPSLVRWGCLAAALSLAAALMSPIPITGWAKAWVMLSHPDNCSRYFVLPMLAWIGVLFSLVADRSLLLRGFAICLIGLLLVELPGDWHLPPIDKLRPRTDFDTRARIFATASLGTKMEFPVHPVGAPPMVLIK